MARRYQSAFQKAERINRQTIYRSGSDRTLEQITPLHRHCAAEDGLQALGAAVPTPERSLEQARHGAGLNNQRQGPSTAPHGEDTALLGTAARTPMNHRPEGRGVTRDSWALPGISPQGSGPGEELSPEGSWALKPRTDELPAPQPEGRGAPAKHVTRPALKPGTVTQQSSPDAYSDPAGGPPDAYSDPAGGPPDAYSDPAGGPPDAYSDPAGGPPDAYSDPAEVPRTPIVTQQSSPGRL
ncbi:hypothetical protein NDU88_000264 [Pleurodeles waltl]|uniref:Uncharacterized protein n=1 Tax=Pleurodeles waltl TaxID=8319 RepID=A0AAV7SWL0_PLEWA|nr:hypothetical protein NDU88_000264 [Pleurodeles waltl]